MLNDLSSIFYFWLTLLIIGAVFLPLTTQVFSFFADRGYIFAKILGLALTSYLLWFLGSLHLLPFSTFSIWLILLLAVGINLFVIRKLTQEETQKIKSKWKIFAFEEIIFFSALLFWAYIRSYEPSIHGLEKFMDFGFINSILRAEFFPPYDLWLTPETINYYYFGHLTTALLTKLSGIPPEVSYNLMLAALFALTFTAAFSIGLNLFNLRNKHLPGVPQAQPHLEGEKLKEDPSGSAIICGLLSAFLVALGGNLHTFYAFTRGFDKYWYPDATRFIPYTIHEFPSYSWVVADLHGHVLDIPFVLLTIAILYALIISARKKHLPNNLKYQNSNLKSTFQILKFLPFKLPNLRFAICDLRLLLISFLLAVMYMTNAWDGIIYLGLAIFVLFSLHLKIVDRDDSSQIQNYSLKLKIFTFKFNFCLLPFAFCLLLLLFGFFLFSLPFNFHFKPFASGIHLVRDRSPLYMLAILWGFFYFSVASFLLFLFPKIKSSIINHKSSLNQTDIFVLLLIFLSTLLLIFPEVAYIKDIYPLHYRANTIFKLGYQAFIMLSISSAYIAIRIITSRKNLFVYLFICLFVILFVPVAIYPYFSIKSYYGNLKNYQSLDGMVWLKKQYPSDYRAILWLRENVQGQPASPARFDARRAGGPVILEAVGESYTDYARVSSFTGLPTVVGWPVHEWLWRGSYDEAGKRDAEVRRAYETRDFKETRSFLQKYNVQYVFVGTLERQKYPTADFTKWKSFGKAVFQFGQTTVYQTFDSPGS